MNIKEIDKKIKELETEREQFIVSANQQIANQVGFFNGQIEVYNQMKAAKSNKVSKNGATEPKTVEAAA